MSDDQDRVFNVTDATHYAQVLDVFEEGRIFFA